MMMPRGTLQGDDDHEGDNDDNDENYDNEDNDHEDDNDAKPCKESSEPALFPLQTFLHRSNLLVVIIIKTIIIIIKMIIIIIKMIIIIIIIIIIMMMMTRPDYKEERAHYRNPLSLDRAPTGSRKVLPLNPR